MISNNKSHALFLLPATLSIWLILSGLSVFLVDPATFFLALSLLALTTTLALTYLFPFAGWIAATLSIITYVLVQIGLNAFTLTVLPPIGLFTFIILVTTWLGNKISSEVKRINLQLDNDQKLIEELRLFDPETGLLRYQYVFRTLKTEIARSRRFEKNLCVLLIGIGNIDAIEFEHSMTSMEDIVRQLAIMLTGSLRTEDIPFSGIHMGAILPETNLEGAQIVVNRLISNASRKVRIALHIGIAQFPSDGVSEDDLIQSAHTALQVSENTGQPYITYAQVQKAANSKPELPTGAAPIRNT